MKMRSWNRVLWWAVAVVAIAAIGAAAYFALREPAVVGRMRSTLPLSFDDADSAVAVMQAIDTATLRSDTQRALHTLYLQNALYKQNRGKENLAALDTFENYFASRPDNTEKMLYLYLHGESLSMRKEYAKALRCFLPALKIARETGYTKFEGRICRVIQNIYTQQMNSEMALKYAMKALTIFKRTGEDDMYRWQVWEVAQCLFNTKEFERSLKYVARSRKLAEEANDTLLRDYINRIASIDNLKLGNARKAVDYLQNLKFKEELYDNYRLADAYYALGNMDSATYYANKVREIDKNYIGIITLIALNDTDYKRANVLIKKHLDNEEEMYQELIKNNIAGIESEFHATDALQKREQNKRDNIIAICIIIILVLISIGLYIFYLKKNRELRNKAASLISNTEILKDKYKLEIEKKQNEISIINKQLSDIEIKLEKEKEDSHLSTRLKIELENLKQALAKKDEELSSFHILEESIDDRFDIINNICDALYVNKIATDNDSAISQNDINRRIANSIINSIKKYREDPAKIQLLERTLDNRESNAMTQFKEEMPNTSTAEILLFLYKGLRMPNYTIAYFLNTEIKNIHTRTSRLRKKIQQSEAPNKVKFMEMLA